jgi:hypothetical protein
VQSAATTSGTVACAPGLKACCACFTVGNLIQNEQAHAAIYIACRVMPSVFSLRPCTTHPTSCGVQAARGRFTLPIQACRSRDSHGSGTAPPCSPVSTRQKLYYDMSDVPVPRQSNELVC